MKKNNGQKISRYVSGIPLLLAFLAPYVMVFSFFMQQSAIRRSLKERFERTHLVRLHLAPHEFEWVKKGKEISVNRRMFDIKKMEMHENGTTFYGIFDDEETALVDNWLNTLQKERRNTFFHHTGIAFLVFGQSLQTKQVQLTPVFKETPAKPLSRYCIRITEGFSAPPFRPPSVLAA